MTREEAINRLRNMTIEVSDYCNASKHMSEADRQDMETFDMAIKALEQEPRWIPVIEKLPEEGGDYLVTVCYNLIGKGTVREVKRDFFCILSKKWLYEGDEVLAWMPLPKPYGEVEE